MTDVSLIFEVHQPIRLNKHGIRRDQKDLFERYFSSEFNKFIFDKVARNCYYPATDILLNLVDNLKNEKKPFKVAFSITGLWLEQAERWHPDLLEMFKSFPKNRVEFLDETYYHSLTGLFEDSGQFLEDVKEHREAIKSYFGYEPKTFTNTELIYNNSIGRIAKQAGYKAVFTEGVDRILGWRSPNYVYTPPSYVSDIKILLRNRRLTDDIGYRFSQKEWDGWPLTAEKHSSWVAASSGQCVNLFMDFETFGEHHWEGTGILWFLRAFPYQILKYDHLHFALPHEIAQRCSPVGEYDVFEYNTISWADLEMDVSAWLGNDMQRKYFEELKSMLPLVKQTGDPHLLKVWKILQTSDHLHNICTKWWGDGDVHRYFSYFEHPQQGFSAIADVIFDFKERVFEKLMKKKNPSIPKG
ncbi:MAG: glycoside hydrolase family 57 protein [Candidatus Aenigmarchaeota archaeon]|nr:glycoside hydrolase family 57 protein [Candidatus Aenigmarchaeota archaeon]